MLDAVGHAIEEGRSDEALQVLSTALTRQRETIQSLRDLSFNLEPVVLRDEGFGAAVKALADRLALDESVEVDVDVAAGEALAERAQVALYQLIREALGQAAGRKPGAVAVTVADLPDGGATLTVADDGRLERRRSGVETFQERVQPLSGSVQIDRTETGTAVVVSLPKYAVRG